MREVWKSHAGGVEVHAGGAEVSCGRCGTLVYQAFSCIPNDRKLNLLSNGAVESFWDAVWLGIEPFLCFIWISIDFRSIFDRFSIDFRQFGVTLGTLWSHFGVTLGSLWACWGRKVKMLRFHRLRPVLSGPINSKPTFLRGILPVQRRPWYDKKGNRRDKGAIGAKYGFQKRSYPTLFDVEKVNCFGSKCFVSILKIVLPAQAGSTFL